LERPRAALTHFHAIAQNTLSFSQDMVEAIWLLARSITMGELSMAEACGQLEIQFMMADRKQVRAC